MYEWTHGENQYQEYYDVNVNGDYLLVFRNKFEKTPNTWMGQYNNTVIWDKTFNDRERKKEGLSNGCEVSKLKCLCVLTNKDPRYMMKKVERCYKAKKNEICR